METNETTMSETKTDNELQITLEDFKLIKSFYMDFHKKEVQSNDFIIGWSELMPVVVNIEQHGCIIEISLCLGKLCRIEKVLSKTPNWHTTHESNSTIESVYKSVVEFIKWHNQQTPPNGN